MSELEYVGADSAGTAKYQLKKSILIVPRNKTRRTTQERRPKNLPHLTFEDEKCKHCTFAKELKRLRDWKGRFPTKRGKYFRRQI